MVFSDFSRPSSDAEKGSSGNEKARDSQVERVATHDGVPGQASYYEKDGLRTEGDGEPHQEMPMSKRRIVAFVAQAFLWTGSQVPVYFFGAVPPYIYGDIGGSDRWVWFVLANLLSLAAVCPFTGQLSDMFGRRHVALGGAACLIVGMIICSTAQTMNVFIGGMVFAGVGAGINELTALAATSELAPTAQRGKYVAGLVLTILPFCPSALWAHLICYYSSWRYCGLFCALWAFVGFVLTAVFYFPPPRANADGLTRREVAGRVDYVGGLLSVSGLILFMAGMQWGGYQYAWSSPHVLVPLLLGLVLLAAFAFWEARLAPFPMFPSRLAAAAPRTLALTLVITLISGANFFAVLMFWPVEAFNVYGHGPVGVGLRCLPVGLGIMAGACLVLWLLTVFRGGNKWLMVVASVCMTAGVGALAVADVGNLYRLWGILVLASLGIGGIVVPASIMTMIICPDDLIATVGALTLSIRVVGGSIGYCAYYNIFISKFVPRATAHIGAVLASANLTDPALVGEVIALTGASLTEKIGLLPGIAGNATLLDAVVAAGRVAYVQSYAYVYYASIAFGAVSIVAALCLDDISIFMDDHVAVVM